MASQEPLIRFYDLSGPKPWSPYCWCARYALNYKQIPYTVTKISYPGIRPKCEELFPDMTGLEATAPIIEILQAPYKALNDSVPIANLLNERFTEKDGYKHLRDIDKVEEYRKSLGGIGRPILTWVINDVYNNALDSSDGSKEFFKRTREKNWGECKYWSLVLSYIESTFVNFLWSLFSINVLKQCSGSTSDILASNYRMSEMGITDERTVVNTVEERGGGEQKLLEIIRERWVPLQERMKNEDGTGDRES
jgi:hypothetical protein